MGPSRRRSAFFALYYLHDINPCHDLLMMKDSHRLDNFNSSFLYTNTPRRLKEQRLSWWPIVNKRANELYESLLLSSYKKYPCRN
jgi:hypothetical protein